MPEYFVVLVEPVFEESVGFVARSMKNFGLHELCLVNPLATLSANGRMRAGHAQDVLDSMTVQGSLSQALDGADITVGTTAWASLSSSNLLRCSVTPRELAHVVGSAEGKVALVFGREGTGLNDGELGRCDVVMTIPSARDYLTLNLFHAAAIVFYELFQVKNTEPSQILANEATKQKILELLSKSAYSVGVKEYKVGIAVRTLRNIIGRSGIRRREASVLAGVLRKISDGLTKHED
ncbi:MAG TPA: TrmJ/YjtD family RNA methyltransferase [Candidatus Bathyarchaeia archaeon]|nr:TrmJ/YjtD family RNA methyltransferase [Candidatus Bathyarchaeia archaeon]